MIIENLFHPEQSREQFIKNHLMSDEFIAFFKKNKEPFDTLICYYQCAIMEIETKFNVLDHEFSLQYDRNPIESIKSRIKSTESLMRKVRDRNIPITLESMEENITDIAGIRVVCTFPTDIYLLRDCLLRQDDIRLIKEKDYIKNPKENGYRSLHLIVEVPIFLQNETRYMKVEVQLRTIAMDFWASLEHKLRYKKNLSEEQMNQIGIELKECADTSAALDEKMQNIRDRIITQEEVDEAAMAHKLTFGHFTHKQN